MAHDLRMGEFEELVLLSVAGLSTEAYAVKVQQHLASQAGRLSAMGAVYTALDRLERKGYVRSYMGEVTRKRGGKRKRIYRITSTGVEALHVLQARRDQLWAQARPNLGLTS